MPDSGFDLIHGDFFVSVGVNLFEDLLDLLFPALWQLHLVLLGVSGDGGEDLLEGEGAISVGVEGLEDLIKLHWHGAHG